MRFWQHNDVGGMLRLQLVEQCIRDLGITDKVYLHVGGRLKGPENLLETLCLIIDIRCEHAEGRVTGGNGGRCFLWDEGLVGLLQHRSRSAGGQEKREKEHPGVAVKRFPREHGRILAWPEAAANRAGLPLASGSTSMSGRRAEIGGRATLALPAFPTVAFCINYPQH